jgi:hypothetical protein
MEGTFITNGGNENTHILVVKPQGKGPLRKSTPLWEDNIKID